MELRPLRAGSGRRPLHWRRSLLSYLCVRAGGPPRAGDTSGETGERVDGQIRCRACCLSVMQQPPARWANEGSIGVLKEQGIECSVFDPEADRRDVRDRHGIELLEDPSANAPYHVVIAAVRHEAIRSRCSLDILRAISAPGRAGRPALVDVKLMYDRAAAERSVGIRLLGTVTMESPVIIGVECRCCRVASP